MTASMAVSSKTTQNSLYESKNYKPFPSNNLNNSEMGSNSNNNTSSKKKPVDQVGGAERERERERENGEDHNEEDDDDDHVFHLDLSNNINLYNR